MIKVKATQNFNLKDFDKLKNIQRQRKDVEGQLFTGDIFECDNDMANYLTGNNDQNVTVVEIIEVMPEVKTKVENKPKKVTKKTKKK